MCQGNLDSWVDSVCNTEGPTAAAGFHNEALIQVVPRDHKVKISCYSYAVYRKIQICTCNSIWQH